MVCVCRPHTSLCMTFRQFRINKHQLFCSLLANTGNETWEFLLSFQNSLKETRALCWSKRCDSVLFIKSSAGAESVKNNKQRCFLLLLLSLSLSLYPSSRLQSHFVVANCGVFWWSDKHILLTWGFGLSMCLDWNFLTKYFMAYVIPRLTTHSHPPSQR